MKKQDSLLKEKGTCTIMCILWLSLSAYVTHDCSMIVLFCCVELYCVVCSDEAIEKAHDELTRLRDEVEAWQLWKVKSDKSVKSERESAEKAVIEAAELRKQLKTLQK